MRERSAGAMLLPLLCCSENIVPITESLNVVGHSIYDLFIKRKDMAIHKSTFDKDSRAGVDPDRSGGATRRSDRLKVKEIIGYEIQNPQGDDLGKIDNLMINLQNGEVEYVVVEFGTFLGLGGKLFAVPFKELKLDADKKVFTLDRDKEYLKKAPGFDKDHWPDTNDHSYFNNVTMYYGSYLPPFP
jgi:sporulation protein YlmC with PRC-barrel domain